MMSYFHACDVTLANSNHNFCFFDLDVSPPTLKKVPPPMIVGLVKLK